MKLFKPLQNGAGPKVTKGLVIQCPCKGPRVNFQPPPLHPGWAGGRQCSHHGRAVVPQPEADIEQLELARLREPSQLGGADKFRFRFLQGSCGAVKRLIKVIALKTQASVSRFERPELPERMGQRRSRSRSVQKLG